jgi:hypothetical protein
VPDAVSRTQTCSPPGQVSFGERGAQAAAMTLLLDRAARVPSLGRLWSSRSTPVVEVHTTSECIASFLVAQEDGSLWVV